MGSFQCSIDSDSLNSMYVFVLDGELDIYSTPKLKEMLTENIAPKVSIILDCTNLIFIDSTGLGAIVGALKEASNCDAQLCLAGVNENIRRILAVTGLERLFSIFPTVAEARKTITSPVHAQ